MAMLMLMVMLVVMVMVVVMVIDGDDAPPSRGRYATFAAFAGVDPVDHRAALAGLPPLDSHDFSSVILGATA